MRFIAAVLYFVMLIYLNRANLWSGQGLGFRALSKSLLSLTLSSSSSNTTTSSQGHEVTTTEEKVVFEGYRSIVRKSVILPNRKTVVYDLLTQKHLSVVVFIWDTATATTTLVEEYHPGPNKFLLGTVAGMYESKKHQSILEAAKFELEEEAQLQSDHWYPLLSEDAIMPFDKYSNNKFIPFLVLDCQSVLNAKAVDEEEFITIHRNVTYTHLMEMIANGQVNVVSTYTILLGLKKLHELGIEVNPVHSGIDKLP